MSKAPIGHKAGAKDMYWFAHGGVETDKCLPQRSNTPGELDDESSDASYPSLKSNPDRKGVSEEPRSVTLLKDSAVTHMMPDLGHNSSTLSSLERDDRVRLCPTDKRSAVEDRKKQLWEAEQERNDAVLRKHMEREAALEARRNAQRSNISFAFGSSVPRNLEATQSNQAGELEKLNRFSTTCGVPQKSEEIYETYRVNERHSVSPLNSNGVYGCMGNSLVDGISPRSTSAQSGSCYDRKTLSPPSWLVGSGALIGGDIMSRSMTTGSVSAPRGRRKNDLTPTVPYERTVPPRSAASSSTRKRSVSMTRLDQLAQPRRHYIEANKANSTASSGASSMHKDTLPSPSRPLSSASEQSGGSGRIQSAVVNRRTRASPRKPRPVSIAGTVPDQRPLFEVKVSPIKRSYTPSKRSAPTIDIKKVTNVKTTQPKASESPKPTPRPSTASKPTAKHHVPKHINVKQTSDPKMSTPKVSAAKKPSTNKKKTDILVATPAIAETAASNPVEYAKPSISPTRSSTPDSETNVENDKNNSKRIISEEEAKTALAEKRKLAREQAEREAELERQRQEELRIQEEERLRKEEEEQRKMEEESLRLLEEHRKQEEEKLRKAIEEQERKEEEEKLKKEEELRLKAEQEKKAKEEAERQRIELEEKLRKEEEERAERKKRLDKIMSRTRGKASGTSPSGSISGSDQLDSGENQQEGFSSGANSLDSNGTAELPSEPLSLDENQVKSEPSSIGNSLEANPTYEIVSETESINSCDMMLPTSENASRDNSLLIIPGENDFVVEAANSVNVSDADTNEKSTPVADTVTSEMMGILSESSEISSLGKNEPKQSVPEDEQTVLSTCETDNVEKPTMTDSDVLSHGDGQLLNPEVHSDGRSELDAHAQQETAYSANDRSKNKTDPMLEVESISNVDYVPAPVMNEIYVEQIPDDLTQSDGFVQPVPNYSVEKSSVNSSSILNQAGPEAAEINIESSARDSTSSDMKLPDPIYEITSSDEGSVSSEKPQRDVTDERSEFDNYMFHEVESTEINLGQIPASDDVFSEEVACKGSTLMSKSLNPFATESSFFEDTLNQEPKNAFQDEAMTVVEKHLEESVLLDTGSTAQEVNVFSEVRLESDEINVLSKGSFNVEKDMQPTETSIVKETEVVYPGDVIDNPFLQTFGCNPENYGCPVVDNNPFSDSGDQGAKDIPEFYSNDKSMSFASETAVTSNAVSDFTQNMQEVNYSHFNSGPAGDITFPSSNTMSSPNSEFDKFVPQVCGDSPLIQQSTITSEQNSDCENQTVSDKNASVFHDITVITDNGSGDCIGIISSVDQAQADSNFSKSGFNNEHLKNNFEYPGVTDSEDSSLDSNLSQVMNSEKETDDGLNHVEKTNEFGTDAVFSNIPEQQGYLFNVQPFYNGDGHSKSNGTHLFSEETVTNGHRIESSEHAANIIAEFPDYMQQLDSVKENDISSVDHPKVNIFENVDAIDFSKVSPDPFLAKGSSNQISGNPFVQDEKKQVLMTPDFFN